MSEAMHTALVVDDDEAIRDLVALILGRNGFTVDCARDGFEAIQKLAVRDYSVVVLDLMMPRVSGFGVIHFLRDRKEQALQNVIVLTAAHVRRIYQEPVFEVVTKPFDIYQLVECAKACSAQSD